MTDEDASYGMGILSIFLIVQKTLMFLCFTAMDTAGELLELWEKKAQLKHLCLKGYRQDLNLVVFSRVFR